MNKILTTALCSLLLASCMNGEADVNEEAISSYDKDYARAMTSFEGMKTVQKTQCGPFDVTFKSNPEITLSQTKNGSSPNFAIESGFWPGFVRFITLKRDEKEVPDLEASTPDSRHIDLYRISPSGQREKMDFRVELLAPPDAYREFWAVSLFKGSDYNAIPWRNYIKTENGPGKYLIHFKKPERFRWDGGSCEVQWPDMEVTITK